MREFKDSVTGKDDERRRSTRTAARARTETADRHSRGRPLGGLGPPVSGPPIENGAVAIEGGRIAAVGPSSELGRGRRFEGAVILPGFVNCHSHLEYAVYTGFGDGTPDFAEWIGIHIQRKQRLAFDDVVDIARLGAAECLASGITTVGDCSFSGAAAIGCHDLGLRGIVYLEVFGSDPLRRARALRVACGDRRARPVGARRRRRLAARAVHRHRGGLRDVRVPRRARGHAPLGERIRAGVPPRRERAVGVVPRAARAAGRHHGRTDARRHRSAHAEPRRRPLRRRSSPDEIELLASHGVGVAHCPRSNALLGCGIAPVRELLDRGVTVGLGTDSPASAPSFDLFDELRAAVSFARARERRPDALSCDRGARARDDRLGPRARPGRRRSGRSSRARRPTSSSSASRARRSSPGRTRRPPSCSAVRRTG